MHKNACTCVHMYMRAFNARPLPSRRTQRNGNAEGSSGCAEWDHIAALATLTHLKRLEVAVAPQVEDTHAPLAALTGLTALVLKNSPVRGRPASGVWSACHSWSEGCFPGLMGGRPVCRTLASCLALAQSWAVPLPS